MTMLEELRNSIDIATKEGILYFFRDILTDRAMQQKDVRILCLNAPGAALIKPRELIIFLSYVRLIEFYSDETMFLKKEYLNTIVDENQLLNLVISNTVEQLFYDKLFTCDIFQFDPKENHYIFKRNLFPLCYAGIRNILINLNFLIVSRQEILLNPAYEPLLSKYINDSKTKISLDELKKKLEDNERIGCAAEEFALHHEQRRCDLDKKQIQLIKRISMVDVGAGYDIVSFMSQDSKIYDKFIEVKAISNNLRFFLVRERDGEG